MNVRNIGSVLDGKYQILSRLGSGGMGEVYRVRHLHLDELRVIKVLRQDLVGDTTLARRFQQEARTSTQIKHPNVATLYDYSQLADGSFYMVWEHIEGQDVASWLRDRGPFPSRLALQLGIQALHGLDAVHAAGVIHRDISPDNLMITRDVHGHYQVKIIDLGLAKTLESDPSQDLTAAGSFLGKMRYCSPEQASDQGEELDQRSDLYSLAAVLYEMVCGLPPFDSESAHGFLIKRLSEDPLPLQGRNPEVQVASELDAALRKGLVRERDQRYPNASAFVASLEKVLGQLQGAQPSSAKPRASPKSVSSSPRELSKEERSDLLARINAAAARAKSGTRLLAQADAAIDEGRLDKARELVARIEESEPGLTGLAALKDKLGRASQAEQARQRIAEAEQMVEGYLKQRKGPLARFALQALLELDSDHPRKADYENWIQLLDEEKEQQARADASFEAGRDAVKTGDAEEARRQLEIVRENDLTGELGDRLAHAIESALAGKEKSVLEEESRGLLETCLAAGDVAGAEAQLERLSNLDVARVTVMEYRRRIDEIRGSQELEAKTSRLEGLYRERLDAQDWEGAREVAQQISRALPGLQRAGEMLREVAHLQDRERKLQATEAGIRQLEQLLETGQLQQAELAFKIVVQMSPDHTRLPELEQRLQALRG